LLASSVAPSAPARIHPTQLWTNSVLFVPIVPIFDLSLTVTPVALTDDPATDPPAQAAVFFHAFQPLDFFPARSSIVDTFTPDKVFWLSRIHASSHFTFAVEVGERDVEAVDVGGDYGQEEHDAIEDEIFIGAGKEHHGQRWEEYVAKGDDEAFEEGNPHLDRAIKASKQQTGEVC